VRAPGVVNGGWLPSRARGTAVDGLVHLADWYATFCTLAAVDPTDKSARAAGLPPIDSIDMCPLLSGENTTSPRGEILLTPLSADRYNGTNMRSGDAALIVGRYKLIVGNISQASWCGPTYPNRSHPWDTWKTIEVCSQPASSTTPAKVGCLFNIYDDPEERNDLAIAQAKRARVMYDRLVELDATVFNPDRGAPDVSGACEQVTANNGFFGPWLP